MGLILDENSSPKEIKAVGIALDAMPRLCGPRLEFPRCAGATPSLNDRQEGDSFTFISAEARTQWKADGDIRNPACRDTEALYFSARKFCETFAEKAEIGLGMARQGRAYADEVIKSAYMAAVTQHHDQSIPALDTVVRLLEPVWEYGRDLRIFHDQKMKHAITPKPQSAAPA